MKTVTTTYYRIRKGDKILYHELEVEITYIGYRSEEEMEEEKEGCLYTMYWTMKPLDEEKAKKFFIRRYTPNTRFLVNPFAKVEKIVE